MRTTIFFTQKQKERLALQSQHTGLKMSELIRRSIDYYLDQTVPQDPFLESKKLNKKVEKEIKTKTTRMIFCLSSKMKKWLTSLANDTQISEAEHLRRAVDVYRKKIN